MKRQVLIVSPSPAPSFAVQDRRLLSADFEAQIFPYSGVADLPALWQSVRRCDLVLMWFAGRHAPATVAVARASRRPLVTIIGGYEVAWLPEIGYGRPPGSCRDWLTQWALNHSQQIVNVSGYNHELARGRFPALSRRMRLIPNAVDTSYFKPNPSIARTGVLSVGNVQASSMKVKNWEWYREIARLMPDIQFTLIGPAPDELGKRFVKSLPSNLSWKGALFGSDLLCEYQQASVYFMGSHHESFSVATAEAMACGCIPVVSERGALPELVGDAGYISQVRHNDEVQKLIRTALTSPATLRDTARTRIIDRYDITRRREALGLLIFETLEVAP